MKHPVRAVPVLTCLRIAVLGPSFGVLQVRRSYCYIIRPSSGRSPRRPAPWANVVASSSSWLMQGPSRDDTTYIQLKDPASLGTLAVRRQLRLLAPLALGVLGRLETPVIPTHPMPSSLGRQSALSPVLSGSLYPTCPPLPRTHQQWSLPSLFCRQHWSRRPSRSPPRQATASLGTDHPNENSKT